jgi:drug/metabolite transporter (DMT)-like permease
MRPAPDQASRARVLVFYLLVACMWGSTFLWIRIATRGASPLTVAEIRLAVGASVVVLIVRLSPGAREQNRFANIRPWIVRGIPISLLMAVGPFVLLAVAERGVPSGTASILNSTAPLWAGLLLLVSAIFLSSPDRLPRGGFVGLLVGAAGVWIFVGPERGGNVFDELLVLLSALSYSTAGVYAHHVFRDAPSHAAAILATGTGAVIALPLGIAGWIAHPPTSSALLASAAAGGLPNGIGYVVYFTLVREIGFARSITVTYLLPIVALILGVIFLDEQLFARELVGLVLVMIGVAAVNGQLPLFKRLTRPPLASGTSSPAGDLQAQSEIEIGKR